MPSPVCVRVNGPRSDDDNVLMGGARRPGMAAEDARVGGARRPRGDAGCGLSLSVTVMGGVR